MLVLKLEQSGQHCSKRNGWKNCSKTAGWTSMEVLIVDEVFDKDMST